MSRNDYKYLSQSNFSGGINLDPEFARRDQVADARNVWAPDGRLVQRPGYKSVGRLGEYVSTYTISGAGNRYLLTETGGTFTDHSAAVTAIITGVNSWLLGAASLPFSATDPPVEQAAFLGAYFACTAQNAAAVRAYVTYWNGSMWKRLDAVECSSTNLFTGTEYFPAAEKHCATADCAFLFTMPSDWAATTLAGKTGYFLRIFPLNDTSFGSLTAGTTVTRLTTWLWADTSVADSRWKLSSVTRLQGVSAKRYFHAISSSFYFASATDTYADACFTHHDIRRRGLQQLLTRVADDGGGSLVDPRLTSVTQAVIPEFDLAYVAFEGKLVEVKLSDGSMTFPPPVNTTPELVGTIGAIKSPYHPDYVPQLATFPKASLITYFKGVLWVVEPDNPFTIRWSAPAIDGAYNIWPEDAFETIAEEDNSPITAIAALHENLIVFKRDSIWMMAYTGLNDLELPTFTPLKVVSGVGCVAPGSVQQVRGRLIFLAESGVYAFNGTPDIQKLSYAIDQQIAEINGGAYAQVSSVNWSTQGVYILSAPLKGDAGVNRDNVLVAPPENQFCFVYDYETTQPDEVGRPVGSWWFWDNFPARHFILDENGDDKQVLYIVGSFGRVYQVIGDTDHGGTIDSYFTTHRMRDRSRANIQAREVRITADQDVNALTVTLITEDEDGTARSMSFSHDDEAKFGTALYGTDSYVKIRRRERRLDCNTQGKWFQVKVENPTKAVPMRIERLDIGYRLNARR